MDIKTITESNRDAWNEAIKYHQKARNNHLQRGFVNEEFTTFTRECDSILLPKIGALSLEDKIICQMPCNNGRELLSLLRITGARKAIGFDISDVAIKEAQELTTISKMNAEFHRVNILEIDSKYDNAFDMIYISEGSLQWFPALDDYFKVVTRLLKKDGKLLIFEMHPFAYFFEQAGNLSREVQLSDFICYFEKGPYSYEKGIDYIGHTSYDAKKCYWFLHKWSDILNAVIQSAIEIEEINEYNFEIANNLSASNLNKFPLSYLIIGKKK
jgi:SAM-dependent methyltransferase